MKIKQLIVAKSNPRKKFREEDINEKSCLCVLYTDTVMGVYQLVKDNYSDNEIRTIIKKTKWFPSLYCERFLNYENVQNLKNKKLIEYLDYEVFELRKKIKAKSIVRDDLEYFVTTVFETVNPGRKITF